MSAPRNPLTASRPSTSGAELRIVKSEPISRLADADLVRLCQDASSLPSAASELLRRFHPLVLRILQRSLGPDGDVHDVAQEVFLRFFRRIHTLRDAQALKAFVIAVTVNVLKWELRKRELRRWISLDGKIDRHTERSGTFAVDEDAREAFARLYEILATLKPRDRLLFSLRFLEEMSVEEIADATRIPNRTLKRHLARIWSRVISLANRDAALVEYVGRLQEPPPSRAVLEEEE